MRTIMADQILSHINSVDYLVLGEGEYVFKELLHALRTGTNVRQVRGIAYRTPGNNIVTTQRQERISQLDDLPFPCYDSLDAKKLAQTKHFNIVTSRGCQFRCTYCSAAHFFSHSWYHRSEANILEEITLLKRKYNPDLITFSDACVTTDMNYAKKLFASIEKEKFGIEYHLQTRTEFVDEELLVIMKKAGVRMLGFGIESGSLRIRKYAKRPYSSQQLQNEKTIVQLTNKHGIRSYINIIVGWPHETWNDLRENVRLISAMKPKMISINPLTLYPGNVLYQEQVREEIISDEYWLSDQLPPKYLILKKGVIGRCQCLLQELILFIAYVLNSSSLHGICLTIGVKLVYLQMKFNGPFRNKKKVSEC